MVFDHNGLQMEQYQGLYESVRAKILADAPLDAEFLKADWTEKWRRRVERDAW
jgi:hypothetical protein